jgi:hypothetical protein
MAKKAPALPDFEAQAAAIGAAIDVVQLLEQALRIGQEIKDPRIIQIASAKLQKLRGG